MKKKKRGEKTRTRNRSEVELRHAKEHVWLARCPYALTILWPIKDASCPFGESRAATIGA